MFLFLIKDGGSQATIKALASVYGTQYEHGTITRTICKYILR